MGLAVILAFIGLATTPQGAMAEIPEFPLTKIGLLLEVGKIELSVMNNLLKGDEMKSCFADLREKSRILFVDGNSVQGKLVLKSTKDYLNHAQTNLYPLKDYNKRNLSVMVLKSLQFPQKLPLGCQNF